MRRRLAGEAGRVRATRATKRRQDEVSLPVSLRSLDSKAYRNLQWLAHRQLALDNPWRTPRAVRHEIADKRRCPWQWHLHDARAIARTCGKFKLGAIERWKQDGLQYSSTSGFIKRQACERRQCCLYATEANAWHVVALVEGGYLSKRVMLRLTDYSD